MIYIGLGLLFSLLCLAIISRIHFSKYKGRKKNMLGVLYCSMAETVYGVLKTQPFMERVKDRMRKLYVVSEQELMRLVHAYVVRIITTVLAIMTAAVLLTLAACFMLPTTMDDENTIEREDYLGGAKEQSIILSYGKNEKEYKLEISQQQYSEAEFYEQAELLLREAEDRLLAAQTPDTWITQDLSLLKSSENGLLEIGWSSDRPDILTSEGKLVKENLGEGIEPVVLTATVTYEEYELSESFPVAVGKRSLSETEKKFEDCIETIKELEQTGRDDPNLDLPKEIADVRVNVKKKNPEMPVKVLLFGFLLSAVVTVIYVSRLKERERVRDNELTKEYATFVNRLHLLLATGMTIRQSFERLARDDGMCEQLKREIRYLINEIDTGAGEAKSYERLGARLKLPAYRRLMSHIAQNLKLGTGHLSELMEREVENAMLEEREYAKKHGEEVSSKLLFPMTLLLFVTMALVVCPALMGLW